jgi:Asp-tRNA(Asn)/Glu-tRNA(Gln) amidotransferase A subunit family amidase
VRLAVGQAVARLREGHQVDDTALPLRDELAQVYRTILLAEAATVHDRTLADHAELLGAPTRELLAASARITTQEYLEALARRAAFGQACDELLTRYDCLLAPTTLVPAPAIGQAEVEVDGRPLPVRDALLACTSPFSMIGLPALSVPCQAEGLPVGLQLIGPRRGDALVLELGEVVELLRR